MSSPNPRGPGAKPRFVVPPKTTTPKNATQSARAPSGASVKQRDGPRAANIEPIVAFYVFFASHIAAALYSPIQDCDEVFNYWEPIHYLTQGHGFQTWEYAPEFAIRSWAYAGLHAIVLPLVKLFPYLTGTKVVQFYFLRIVLGFVCAACEARLFSKVATTLNGRVAMLYLLITVTSPGMYHASVAFLPSSFAMYYVMLGMAAFMDWRGGLRTAQGIWCFGVGACFGWPFAVILAAPFLVEELLMASVSNKQGRLNLVRRLLDGVGRAGGTLFLQIAIDCCFYRKFELVPLNIVMYNVFSSKGPDLYGTEPWHFYLRNLFLNFHFWLPLAVLSLPLLVLQQVSRGRVATKSSYLRGVIFLSPFYLWLAVFTLQPHKEERFMYPAYPAIALNAAIAFNIVLANMGSTSPQDLMSRIPVRLRLAVILAFVFVANTFFASRTYGTFEAYSAPLSIYQPLHEPGMAQSGNSVCLGKEWYRFPSHFLLPDGVRAKFIKSEFSGLLPGEFSEVQHGFGLFPGAWISPPGMNDENREDIYKYTDVRRCTFIVDSHLPSTQTTALEPSYILDERTWEKVKCLPYLDNASTGTIGRLGWIPDLPFIPTKYKRIWGEYCLLKRRSKPQVVAQGAYTNIELML